MELLTTQQKLIKIIRSCKTKTHIDCARQYLYLAKTNKYITDEEAIKAQKAFDTKNTKIMGECYEIM